MILENLLDEDGYEFKKAMHTTLNTSEAKTQLEDRLEGLYLEVPSTFG